MGFRGIDSYNNGSRTLTDIHSPTCLPKMGPDMLSEIRNLICKLKNANLNLNYNK